MVPTVWNGLSFRRTLSRRNLNACPDAFLLRKISHFTRNDKGRNLFCSDENPCERLRALS